MGNDLACRILEPGISDSDIAVCVNAHNEEWSKFFRLTPDIFKHRLDSGEFFLGVYESDELRGFLEATSHLINGIDGEVPQSRHFEFAKKIARKACAELDGSYLEMTEGGLYKPRIKTSNVLLLMDINVLSEYRQYGYGGHLVNYLLSLLLQEKTARPAQLADIIVVPTLTPELPKPMGFHEKYGAFDTEFRRENVRPGYNQPRAHYWCYLSPGFSPKLNTRAA